MNRNTILLCLFTLFILAGCHAEVEVEHEAEGYFVVTHPVRKDTVITTEYVCQIHSIRNIEIRALEGGYLQSIHVDEGQFVKEGQLMFQIKPLLYQAELQKAKAEAKFAEIEYLNTKALADSNIVSPNELALARARLDRAEAEVSLARVHLGFTTIRAPFSGIMDRLQVRNGSLVEEGELLTTLSDNSQMWVYFNVPEAEYLNYSSQSRQGNRAKVRLRMANNELFPHQGEVSTIEAEFNHETGNIPFRATFPNPDGLLRHGETGNILMSIPLQQAMIIPQKSTFEVLDKQYVYVVDSKNEVHARHVTVAHELPHLFVISEGLKLGDKVLVEGLHKVKEGDEIHYVFKEPEVVMSQLDLYAE